MIRAPAMVGALLGIALASAPANAITVRSIQASFVRPSYRVSLIALLDATPQEVEAVLVDYRSYGRLDPRIRSSNVLSSNPDGTASVRTRIRFCAAFFCRTIDRVEYVQHGTGELVANVVPELSELKRGRTRTTWRAEGMRTLVTYDAEFAPTFWVPEIIARRYAAPALRSATVTLFTNVERRAHER